MSSVTLACASAVAFGLAQHSAHAAAFSLSGNYRLGFNMLVNNDLADGTRAGAGNTDNYLEHRLQLRPDILIDERFSIKSEVTAFAQSGTSTTTLSLPPQFGSTLDSSANQANGAQNAMLSYLYLDWASDWGVFHFGRVPKGWGLGILYNEGKDPLDDYQTITDRAEFQAMLGNLGLRLAYGKESEGLLTNNGDDSDTYELALDYANPESDANVGLMYVRNVRSGTARKSSHDLSIFARRTFKSKFTLGGEFVSIAENDVSAVNGVLAQADFTPGHWTFGYDFALAQATSNSKFTFNANYKPFMFLFRQNVGSASSSTATRTGGGVGADVTGNGGGGAMVNKAEVSYKLSDESFTFGSNFGFAKLMRQGAASSDNLGFETDLFAKQKWYDNFSTYYTVGLLVPGKAFGTDPKTAWGVELKGVLKF